MPNFMLPSQSAQCAWIMRLAAVLELYIARYVGPDMDLIFICVKRIYETQIDPKGSASEVDWIR